MRLHTRRDGRRRWRLSLLVDVPAVIVTAVMVVHVVANALMRRYANRPLPDTLELVQYWYVPVLALLGFVAAQARNEHIATDLLLKGMPSITKPPLVVMGLVLCLVTAAGFAWYGLEKAQSQQDIGATAMVSDLPVWPVYFLVPAVFTVLTIQFAIAALKVIIDPSVERGASVDEASKSEVDLLIPGAEHVR